MKIKLCLLLILVSAFSALAFSQNKAPKFPVVVKINVKHDSDRVENEWLSHVKEAITKLNNADTDVRIADPYAKRWDYTVSLTMADFAWEGQKKGYVVSLTIGRNTQCLFDDFQESGKPERLNDCVALMVERVSLVGSADMNLESTKIAKALQNTYGTSQILFNVRQILQKP